MPKMKSNSGAKKRFKKTGTGKFKHNQTNRRHLLTSKKKGRKRHLRGSKLVAEVQQHQVRAILPYGN
jgi:large subunit ribosomal protein L35